MTDVELARAIGAAAIDGAPVAMLAAIVAAGRAGEAIDLLRGAADDRAAEVRLLAQVGLARAGDRDVALVDRRLRREGELAVLAVLAWRAAALPIDGASLANLIVLASHPATPAELRAGCAWAVAARDAERGGWLAGAVLADDEAAFWLASIVARRGGVLAPIVAGLPARPELDRVASLVAAGAPSK